MGLSSRLELIVTMDRLIGYFFHLPPNSSKFGWWKKGYLSCTGSCFDIWNTIKESLVRFIQTGNPYSGSNCKLSQGNGSIMRLAPVPMFFASDLVEAIEMGGQSSRTTHGASTCIDAYRYLGGLIAGALIGTDSKYLIPLQIHQAS